MAHYRAKTFWCQSGADTTLGTKKTAKGCTCGTAIHYLFRFAEVDIRVITQKHFGVRVC